LLIVDDGSPVPASERLTDAAVDGLCSVTFVYHNENRGANAARNTGIRTAAGEYLAFLDDDDRWHETKIARQVDVFSDAGPEVGVVYTGKRGETRSQTSETLPSAEGDVLKDLFLGANFGQFSSVMVRADVVEAAGLPDERFPAWQDREWFCRLAQHCQFQPVREVLTYRDVAHNDRISTNFVEKRDVAYPLFVKKHYSLAREQGLYCARTFLAGLKKDLGRTAIKAGEYREARKYFVRAFFTNPLYSPVYGYLLASLGGERAYKFAAAVRQRAVDVVQAHSDR
jgi:glycosyltransferase involved in cell wall biosynthesis